MPEEERGKEEDEERADSDTLKVSCQIYEHVIDLAQLWPKTTEDQWQH